MIRTLVVDDEPYARRGMVVLLKGESDFEVVGEARSGLEAVRAIEELTPDVVFLDIKMPDLDGFEVLEAVGDRGAAHIVFVTAYDEHALRAFDAHALDYLLKPVDGDRFQRCLKRIRKMVSSGSRVADFEALSDILKQHARRPLHRSRLIARTEQGFEVINVRDIDWIEARDYYAGLHVGDMTYLVKEALTRLAEQLDSSLFVHIHRSTIVNLGFVKLVEPASFSAPFVELKDGTRRRISRKGRVRFERAVGNSD